MFRGGEAESVILVYGKEEPYEIDTACSGLTRGVANLCIIISNGHYLIEKRKEKK